MIGATLGGIGRPVLQVLVAVGRVALFAAQVLGHLLRPPFYLRELGVSILQIGWYSLPVVGLTAIFTGGALALQIYAGGSRFNAESVVPSIVAIGMTRELGPVLGGLMVAARVASSIAAEIGTMKVTEQIDALVTLSTNPLKYLAVPRVVAATLAMPVLVLNFKGDTWAPEAAASYLLGKLPQCQREQWTWGDADTGGQHLDHFSWTKHPQLLAPRIAAWLQAH